MPHMQASRKIDLQKIIEVEKSPLIVQKKVVRPILKRKRVGIKGLGPTLSKRAKRQRKEPQRFRHPKKRPKGLRRL